MGLIEIGEVYLKIIGDHLVKLSLQILGLLFSNSDEAGLEGIPCLTKSPFYKRITDTSIRRTSLVSSLHNGYFGYAPHSEEELI